MIFKMREILGHGVGELNSNLIVFSEENSRYVIQSTEPRKAGEPPQYHKEICFQHGPVQDGINGISNEVLLSILIDRIRGFQEGPLSCRENALAITKLEEAMHWLHARTRDRIARGVEGRDEK